MVANNSGIRVSFMPRSDPDAMVWIPSAIKNVAPTSNSVAVSSAAAPAPAPRKTCAIANRPRITTSVMPDMKPMPRPVAMNPARLTAAPDGVTDPHGGRHSDPERHHEQNRRDLQRDLMRRQRGGADQPHQQPGGAEQAIFQQEGDRDRRAQDDELSHQWPVDAPNVSEHVIFPERPPAGGKPETREEHRGIDHGSGEPRAEQFQPRQ